MLSGLFCLCVSFQLYLYSISLCVFLHSFGRFFRWGNTVWIWLLSSCTLTSSAQRWRIWRANDLYTGRKEPYRNNIAKYSQLLNKYNSSRWRCYLLEWNTVVLSKKKTHVRYECDHWIWIEKIISVCFSLPLIPFWRLQGHRSAERAGINGRLCKAGRLRAVAIHGG